MFRLDRVSGEAARRSHPGALKDHQEVELSAVAPHWLRTGSDGSPTSSAARRESGRRRMAEAVAPREDAFSH